MALRRGRRGGKLTPIQDALDKGFAAQDYRASRARGHRRVVDGEQVSVCGRCHTETDVAAVTHDRLQCEADGSGRLRTPGRLSEGQGGLAAVQQSQDEHERSVAAGRPENV